VAEDSNPPALSQAGLMAQLEGEVARVRRLGGFLSLALAGPPKNRPGKTLALDVARLRERARLHDTLGWYASDLLAIVLPGNDLQQAVSAAQRLLFSPESGATEPLAAGVATVYGEVEGGAEALLQAAQEAHGQAGPGEVKPSATLKGQPRVLVVDDDTTFAQALADTLLELGWEGHPCSDYRDALERVKSQPYDALFLDVVMPGRSGPEILAESFRRHPKRPAVLMSGQDVDQRAILDALALGPVIFVRKPLSREDIVSALQLFRSLLPGSVRRQRS
jgi:CheY-like chemotaxis protein